MNAVQIELSLICLQYFNTNSLRETNHNRSNQNQGYIFFTRNLIFIVFQKYFILQICKKRTKWKYSKQGDMKTFCNKNRIEVVIYADNSSALGFKLEKLSLLLFLSIFIHYSYVFVLFSSFSKFPSFKIHYFSFLKMEICRNEEKSTKMYE